MQEKMNYLKSKIKSKCTGCQACAVSCPKECISMITDDEGFLYPEINEESCIHCGRCIRVCPVSNRNDENRSYSLQVYGYRMNNEDELLKSASGGAFVDITRAFCSDEKKVAIFGVEIDEKLQVKHNYTLSINDIERFRKSKYVQSNVGKSYAKTKEFLEKNYKVVFSGSPCQIAGLKRFLNKEYENLLCIDIVCHGVPSQELFNLAMDIEGEKAKSKVKKVVFREKVKLNNGKYDSKNIKIIYENGNEKIKNVDQCAYLKGFQNSLFYRPSCYECKFASTLRNSDITIMDCWGIEKVEKDIDMHKGFSCVAIHTKLGKNVFEKIINEETIRLSKNYPVDNIAQYSKPEVMNKKRKKFFEKLNKKNFEYKIKKYTGIPLYIKIFRKIKRFIKRGK